MPTFSLSKFLLSKFLPLLIAFCLLPCLFMGRAEAANPVTSGLQLDLEAGVGVFKDAAKTQPATTAGDAVYVWADQSGFGNDFTQATAGNRPAYQPAGINSKPSLRFDGAASFLTGPTNSPNLSTGSYTLTFVFNINSNASYHTLLAKMPAGGDRRIWMLASPLNSNTPGGPAYFSFTRYNGYDDSGVLGGNVTGVQPYPTLPNIVTYQYDSSVSAETIWVNGVRAAYALGALPGADTTDPYQIGAGGTTPAYFLNGDIISEIGYNRLLTTTERVAVEGYERTLSGISAPAAVNTANNIIFHGNSLMQGAYSTGGQTFPAQLLTVLGNNYQGFNLGVGGRTSTDLNNAATFTVDPLFYGGVPNLCVFWEGSNNLVQDGVSAATAYANIVTYCKARRAAGWQVVVLTILPRNASGPYTPATFETARQSVNASIRANWPSFASALVDVGNDPVIGQAGQYANTTYYFADGVHMTNAGYGVVAANAATVIKSLIYTPAGGTKRKTQ